VNSLRDQGAENFSRCFSFFFVFLVFSLSRAHTCIYSSEESSGPSIGGQAGQQTRRGTSKGQQSRGQLTTSKRADSGTTTKWKPLCFPRWRWYWSSCKWYGPYVKLLVPLGTLYIQCRWVLYVFSAVEHSIYLVLLSTIILLQPLGSFLFLRSKVFLTYWRPVGRSYC